MKFNWHFRTKKFCKREIIILSLIISYFLFWELRSIDLPEPQEDEARFTEFAVSIINNDPPLVSSPAHVRIFGRWIPILTSWYHAAGEPYLLVPFLLLGGINIFSIRIFSIFSGVMALLLLYIFSKRLLNNLAALIIVFLTVMDWSFITESKIGLCCGSAMYMVLIGALLCFLEWYKKCRGLYFGLGCFLAGMGICIRAWFFWFVFALALSFIVFLKIIRKKLTKREIMIGLIIGTASFCIAVSPFICHEIRSNFGVIRYGIEHFTKTHGGYNNLHYLDHLSSRFISFVKLPSIFLKDTIYNNSNRSHKFLIDNVPFLSLFLFITSLIWHCSRIILRRGDFLYQRKLLLLLFCAIFLQTPFTLSTLGYRHLFLLLPLTKCLLGVFLFDLINLSNGFRNATIFVLSFVFIISLYGLTNYYSILEKTGSGIYDVVDYLISKNTKRVILMDYGLWHKIHILSEGRINERDYARVFSLNNNESSNELLQQLVKEFQNRENVYLFYAPEFSGSKSFKPFLELVQKINKWVKEIKGFYRKDGKLQFILYGVH